MICHDSDLSAEAISPTRTRFGCTAYSLASLSSFLRTFILSSDARASLSCLRYFLCFSCFLTCTPKDLFYRARITSFNNNNFHAFPVERHVGPFLGSTRVAYIAVSPSFQVYSNFTQIAASSNRPCTRGCPVGSGITFTTPRVCTRHLHIMRTHINVSFVISSSFLEADGSGNYRHIHV